eukprot:gene7793-5606_t
MRSNDVLLQQGSGMTSSNSSWFNSSYRILQTYQSSEQLPEKSIVATLESHDSSPQPTRPPTAKAHFRSLEPQKQVESTKDTSYLKVMEAPQASYPHRLDRYCARHIPAGESAEAAAAAIARQYGVALTNLHLELGQLLLRAYDALFLQKIVQAEQVYVRSTNYVRTIQSVSALLMALLPQIVQRKTTSSPSSKVTIHTFADENHEIMHGLGLRSSSHGIQAPGQASIETFGACPRAIAATKTERAHFQVTPTAMQPVIDRFGDEVRALYPPEIVDTSIPAYCHQRGLPCHVGSAGSTTTSEECMEKAHLEHLMKDADRYYCDRYSGMHGGYEATQLATYPFLHERYTPVAASTVNGGEVTAEEWTAVRAAAKVFWDDVHQQRQFFMHVPSTDRDLLRVLQPLVTLVTSSDGAGAAPKTATTTPTGAAHWVRVVFNGDDVTQSIPACVLERWVVAHVLVQHMSSSAPSTTTATAATASASTTLADFVRDHRRALTRLGQRLFTAPAAGSTSVAFSLCSGAAFTAQIADLLAASTTTTTSSRSTSGSKSGSAAPTTTATSAAVTTKPPVAAH